MHRNLTLRGLGEHNVEFRLREDNAEEFGIKT